MFLQNKVDISSNWGDSLKLGLISSTGVSGSDTQEYLGTHSFGVQRRGGSPAYSPSSTQALSLGIIGRASSCLFISSFLLIHTCIMVMAVQITRVSFNDQIPLNIECQDEKCLRDYSVGGRGL